jgi:UDP-glucuronate 4-epimerase
MCDERFLVTGASGCIGARVVRNLLKEGVSTTSLDLDPSNQGLRLITTAGERASFGFLQGDVTDLSFVEAALRQSQATRITHLAALQLPF